MTIDVVFATDVTPEGLARMIGEASPMRTNNGRWVEATTHNPATLCAGGTHFKSLVAVQEVEIARLGKIADRLKRVGKTVFDEQHEARPRDADVAALILVGVAQQVQSLYTGIEKVLGSALDDVDSGRPSGGDWRS